MAVIKFDVKNGSKESVQHDLNRTLLSHLLPQWKEELESDLGKEKSYPDITNSKQ